MAGAPSGSAWLKYPVSHSTRALKWWVWASEDDAGVEKEHLVPALAQSEQTGNVRLHFFLKFRHLCGGSTADAKYR